MNNLQYIIDKKYHISQGHLNTLIKIIEGHLHTHTVIPLEHEKKIFKEFPQPIKAVLFDVYGTLIHSAAGDIHTDSSIIQDTFEVRELDICAPFKIVRELLQKYIVNTHQQSKKERGIVYPEIDAIHMWKQIATHPIFSQKIRSDEDASICAVYYELYNNPSSAMPHAIEVLEYLHNKNIILGIISNAQFYTPLFLEALFHTYSIWNDLKFPVQIWSYQLLEAKPSKKLFEKAIEKCTTLNILPNEIVYIGNDKRNDVCPPLSLDMGTVLFAGDSISYRPRLDDVYTSAVYPHRIISSLRDIYEFV